MSLLLDSLLHLLGVDNVPSVLLLACAIGHFNISLQVSFTIQIFILFSKCYLIPST